MPVLRLISDDILPKEPKLYSCDLKNTTPDKSKVAIKERTNIKAADLYKLDGSMKEAAVKKTKDSKLLPLGDKLEPKTTFLKAGLKEGDFVYVKPKGAKPNTPASASPSPKATPKAETPADKTPPPTPPPKPPTPKAAPPPPPAPPKPPAPPAAKEPPAPPKPPTPPKPKSPPAPPKPPTPAEEDAPKPPAPPAPPAPKAAPAPPPAPPAPKEAPPAPPTPPAPKTAPPAPPAPTAPKEAPPAPPAPKAAPPAPPAPKAAPPAPPAPKEAPAPPTPVKAAPPPPAATGGKGALPPPPVRQSGVAMAPAMPAAPPQRAEAGQAGGAPVEAGSAVEAFVEELSHLGGGGAAEGKAAALGALISELSMRPTGDRQQLREMGRTRARSPISRWAQENRQSAAADGMLEVAGLIESIERGTAKRYTSPPGGRPAGGCRLDESFRPVRDFLHRIRLEKYEDLFAEAEVDMDVLLEVTEKDLIDLGVGTMGARKRILMEVKREQARRETGVMPLQEVAGGYASPQAQAYGQPQPQHAYHAASDPYEAEREAVARAVRRDRDLERRWEEVALLAGYGVGADEWDRRWDTARRYDQHELHRWRSEPPHYRAASPPPPSRHAILVQRLNDLQASTAAHVLPAPTSPVAHAAPRAASPPQGRKGLPPNWETFYNAQGVPYYFNRVTNTTQWHIPSSPRGRSPKAGRATSPKAVSYNRSSPTQSRRYQGYH